MKPSVPCPGAAPRVGRGSVIPLGRGASRRSLAAVPDLAEQAERGAPGWRLLVTEFRVHAARDPELNRRYADLHARAVDGVARTFVAVSKEGAEDFPVPPRQLAELWLTIETGRALEQIANPDAFGGPGLPVLYRLGEWFAGQPPPQEGQ